MGYIQRENRIYQSLAAYLNEVAFITYGNHDVEYAARIAPIKILPNTSGLGAKLYSLLLPICYWRTLKQVDILKTNQMIGAWAAVIARYLFRKKLVVRCGYEWALTRKTQGTSGLRLRLIYLVEFLVYRSADLIILASGEMKRFVCSTFRVPSDRVHVIPNSIDTEVFKPVTNCKKEPNRIIFVGRLEEQKNLRNLFEAFVGLPDVTLFLVGEGSLRAELETYARNHGVSAYFMGWVPNEQLSVLLNTAAIFILPSYYEGSPKALLEAMACGLPVIATDVMGNREIIEHGVNGYLCPDTDALALRQALTDVLRNPELQDRLGRQARQFIVSNYSLKRLILKELNLLSGLFEHHPVYHGKTTIAGS